MRKTISENNIYSYTLVFEDYFDLENTTEWMARNWSLAFYFIIIYLAFIFGGQLLMRNREPFHLRPALFLWNSFLALFSIMGTIRGIPENVDILGEEGFTASVCDNRMITSIQVSSTWIWLFTLSKVFELIDTVFIVVRKQKLIFLHWYHHITVLLYCWFAYSQKSSTGRWNCNFNFTIHALMYSYYAVRALNMRVPKVVAVLITSSQIIQMIFGIFIALYALNKKSNGYNCMTPYSVLYWALIMYFSYFLLFINFFIHSYLKKSKVRETRKKSN